MPKPNPIYYLYNFKRSNLMLDTLYLDLRYTTVITSSLVGTFGKVSSSSSDGKTPFCSMGGAIFFLLIFLMTFFVLLIF